MPHYLLFCGFIPLYVQLSKNITKCLLLIFTHIFSTHSTICKTWKRKQTMEQQWHRACERTKSKQKQNHATSHSNWPRVLLFDLAHKQCNSIIKDWLHCLTSEPKGRFLVNNILFGLAWCLVMVQIQFSLIKKNKDWTSRDLLTSLPLRPITSYFCLTHHPPQSGRHLCIIPKTLQYIRTKKFLM